MKARQHFYVEGHTRGIPLNEDEEPAISDEPADTQVEEPTISDEPADTQVEEPSLYQKFEKFCSGFITDERRYFGDDIEDVGAPADVWEEQEDAFNTYFTNRRLSVLCLIWEELSFWEALGMIRLRVMYRWTLFRDTVFDKFLPKSAIFLFSRVLYSVSFHIGLLGSIILIYSLESYNIWIVFILLTFLLAKMCFAPRHEVYEKAFRAFYLKDWYNTSLEDEETLSEEDVNGKTL